MQKELVQRRYRLVFYNTLIMGVIFLMVIIISVLQGLPWHLGLIVVLFYVAAGSIMVLSARKRFLKE
ncbi:hypothetical protein JW968_03315 [Candidatus Woesearchaeota archaeon]|nr:hypothetical protein [Candidatus Woesearchaeota archaeon]